MGTSVMKKFKLEMLQKMISRSIPIKIELYDIILNLILALTVTLDILNF